MLKINGREENYNNLFIYEGDKILFETCRPYELDLELENLQIRSARKLNFSKNDCFEIKSTKDTYRLTVNGKDLYIPSSIISVLSVKEKEALKTHGETNFKKEYMLKIYCDAFKWTKHVEVVEDMPKNISLEDYDKKGKFGSGFSKYYNMYDFGENFKTKETKLFKRWLTLDKISEITVESDYFTRCEKTDARIEREKIADILSSCLYSGKTISHYEVEKILEKLNIQIK